MFAENLNQDRYHDDFEVILRRGGHVSPWEFGDVVQARLGGALLAIEEAL